MTLQDLGNIGELVGSIGVIISLIYLALQIRQNTISLRTSTLQEVARDWTVVSDMLAMDADLQALFSKGLGDFNALDENGRGRFGMLMLTMCRRYESFVYHIEQGTLDAATWEGMRETMRWILCQPGAITWWNLTHELFSPFSVAFREYVERELRKPREHTAQQDAAADAAQRG